MVLKKGHYFQNHGTKKLSLFQQLMATVLGNGNSDVFWVPQCGNSDIFLVPRFGNSDFFEYYNLKIVTLFEDHYLEK